ncbi:hypothetical protein S122051_2482 [Staphylococcus aureus subsp. aureus 122051]|nr:hypothetical protein S122051_2482 [Staphylococcus aureus subsp. aureus 122051]EOR47620.1 hypothetical protein M140OLGA_2064 [Staphylococcus aureus subsp. aureus 112808A]
MIFENFDMVLRRYDVIFVSESFTVFKIKMV